VKRVIAVRVDVDTSVGLKKGVPKLLESFSRHGIHATFFVVMGPDTMGKHAKRFKQKGYVKRILSVNPLKLVRSYGLAPFLYGTLLPSPLIGASNPDLLRNIVRAGHELGIHGYDHAEWADSYLTFSSEDIQEEFGRAASAYREIFGSEPESFAAPNWRSRGDLFEVEDRRTLLYASDTRGYHPFVPEVDGRSYKTLQIPTTLPCTHECLQQGLTTKETGAHLLSELHEGINVWTIHDWYEGLNEIHFVDDFVAAAKARGYRFARLGDIARTFLAKPTETVACGIEQRPVVGGIGEVTWQILREDDRNTNDE
jgi:undecaprenyl phosphate-alpha-L-ara4FN deformylase